jgi:hypothetical protein
MKNNRTKAAVLGGALVGGVALTLLSPAAPALAFDSGGLHLDLAVQSPVTLLARGIAADVPVDVTCNSSYPISLNVYVSERVGSRTASGGGYVMVTCTGSPQRVVVRIVATSGTPFSRGNGVASGYLYGCNDATCGTAEAEIVTVKITK